MLKGASHLYAGQEAVAVGAVAALRDDDLITSTHRGHGHAHAHGDQAAETPEAKQEHYNKMMAEVLGKSGGYCKGKGGSMHIADVVHGNLGATGIVGGNMPVAVGAALAQKLQGTDRVVLCFFGDGASNTGNFHEALNMASLWNLPVVFVAENNMYAMSVPWAKASKLPDIAGRACAYGMPGEMVDGMDVLAVRGAVAKAVERARRGRRPDADRVQDLPLVRPLALRPARLPHARGGSGMEEARPDHRHAQDTWKRVRLAHRGRIRQRWIRPSRPKLDDGHGSSAMASPEPQPRRSWRPTSLPRQDHRGRRASASAAARARPQRPRHAPDLLRPGAGRGHARGDDARPARVRAWARTSGCTAAPTAPRAACSKEFGEWRVIDTPISEATIAGAAVGAAMAGMRPVAEIMYVDFTPLAMDQVANQGAKNRYMFGGKTTVPMVMRTEGGAGRAIAAHHSQSLESLWTHFPGIYVVMPSTPYDAKGLLKAAIRDDNPVMFIEHKMLYKEKGPVPEDDYIIPLGVADVKRPGKDVTIVTYSRMVLTVAGGGRASWPARASTWK